MTRTQDWAERLADYVEQCRDRPFEWGATDCATMAVGAVAAMTGETLWTPPYKDAASAAKYMDGVSIADVVDGLLPRVPQGFAQRGDGRLPLRVGALREQAAEIVEHRADRIRTDAAPQFRAHGAVGCPPFVRVIAEHAGQGRIAPRLQAGDHLCRGDCQLIQAAARSHERGRLGTDRGLQILQKSREPGRGECFRSGGGRVQGDPEEIGRAHV
jgi:hypothetical protein